MKLIAFPTTVKQFHEGTQDVTRRKRWLGLKPGTRLMAVERAHTFPPDERPVELGEIEVVSVRREPLDAITAEDVAREGYPGKDPGWFVTHFVQNHGGALNQVVTRIEFRRVREEAVAPPEEREPEPPADETVERSCRECGCTDERACPTEPPCHWVEEDLCSACAAGQPDVAELEVDGVEAIERELHRAACLVADEQIAIWQRGGSEELSKAAGRYLTLRCLCAALTLEDRVAAFLEPYLTDEQIRDVVAGIVGVINPGAARAT